MLLAALGRSLGLGMDVTGRVRNADAAALLAESALDPLGVATPLHDGESVEVTNGPYRLRVAVDRYDEEGERARSYLALYRLSATVRWQEGLRERSLTLTTLRLGPNG